MAESFKMDLLRFQLAGLTPNGSESDDQSGNFVENVSDPTRQELNRESEAARESTEGDFDSTDSVILPSPPTRSPGAAAANDSGLRSAVSIDVVDSISSCASLESYVWSSASSDLPSWSLPEDKETFIWPSKVLVFIPSIDM